jgi:hypothetical protein
MPAPAPCASAAVLGASLGPSKSSSGSAGKVGSSLSGTRSSHHSNLGSLAVLTALRIIAVLKWRRRVGSPRAEDFGLRAHADQTDARNRILIQPACFIPSE